MALVTLTTTDLYAIVTGCVVLPQITGLDNLFLITLVEYLVIELEQLSLEQQLVFIQVGKAVVPLRNLVRPVH